MPCTFLTAATDIFVIAGAAVVATAAFKPQCAPLEISLGAEDDEDEDEDSTVAIGSDGAISAPRECGSNIILKAHASDDDKRAPFIVTVMEA